MKAVFSQKMRDVVKDPVAGKQFSKWLHSGAKTGDSIKLTANGKVYTITLVPVRS